MKQSSKYKRESEHILLRAISLVGKIFGAFLACSSLRTANPFRIERPIKREFLIRIKKNISFNKDTVILAKLSKNKHEKYTSD